MLYRGARVLIMDEPTAVLTPQEVRELFATLRSMTQRGHSIIFISHKLDEVLEIADRVTVLQHGRVTAAGLDAKSVTKSELARLMVGREVVFSVEKKAVAPGPVILSIENLSAENDRGLPALRGLSLQVHAGEIVGMAGVAGNGQTELAQVITGLRRCANGQVKIGDQEISNRPPRQAIDRGVSHIPEDRAGVGSAPSLSVADNLIMKSYRREPISSGWVLNRPVIRQNAEKLKQAYDIAAPTIDTEARLLSGGNLQKMILAREMSTTPQVMIAMQPTRGLDVGAIEAVHRLLLQEREQGAAVLLISEELDEIMSLADRIVVIYEGQIMGEMSAQEANLEKIGLMMAGSRIANSQSNRLAARPHG
jgi:simple sugar transport system ATP-binding protein